MIQILDLLDHFAVGVTLGLMLVLFGLWVWQGFRSKLQRVIAAWRRFRGVLPPGHVYMTTEPEYVGEMPPRPELPVDPPGNGGDLIIRGGDGTAPGIGGEVRITAGLGGRSVRVTARGRGSSISVSDAGVVINGMNIDIPPIPPIPPLPPLPPLDRWDPATRTFIQESRRSLPSGGFEVRYTQRTVEEVKREMGKKDPPKASEPNTKTIYDRLNDDDTI